MAEIRESPARAHWRLKTTFWLDAALVAAHLLFAWSWIASQSRRLLSAQPFRARINYFLNLSLFAIVIAAIFSGILISQKAIPALTGTKVMPELNWRWDTLHNEFSSFLLMFAGFHLAINLEWALAAGERIFRRVQARVL